METYLPSGLPWLLRTFVISICGLMDLGRRRRLDSIQEHPIRYRVGLVGVGCRDMCVVSCRVVGDLM